jgi:hypothetical protein
MHSCLCIIFSNILGENYFTWIGEGYHLRQDTAFSAASSRSEADTMSRPEVDKIFFASFTFVPEI